MKILTILGSARKKGNTATVLGMFEELASKHNELARINITDYEVNGCLGCNVCFKKLDEPGCVQKDDTVSLFKRMIDSDIIIYSTPLYCWSFSGQMKTFLDRHYCLVKWHNHKIINALLEYKKAALLVTCGDPIENNADLIPIIFDRMMGYLKCDVIGKYILPNCGKPSELGNKAKSLAGEMFSEIS